MLVNRVHLPTGANVLILEQVFPPAILADLHQLCERWLHVDREQWITPEGFENRPRWIYRGNRPEYTATEKFLSSPEFAARLQGEVQRDDLEYSHMQLWVEQHGMGPLSAHKEQAGAFLAQIYLTKTEHSYTGTTIHNDKQQILFQLPYRDNFGWFFDTGQTVMHGREHDVPEGIDRFAIMVWFGERSVGQSSRPIM
jgi:hypothetical protein